MTCQGCSVISNSEKPPTKKQPSFLFIGRLSEKKRIKTERGKKNMNTCRVNKLVGWRPHIHSHQPVLFP